MTFLWALLAGAGAVVVYLLLCIVVSGLRPLRLVEGADGRLSTSKLQTWAWTVAVAFAYVAVYTARAVHGDHSALATVPRNVLIALGFSVGTMVAAKGITSAYVNSKLPLTKPPAAQSSVADLVADDSGVPDLSKTQFLVFTLIAIGIFIVNVLDQVNNITLNGPTPDNSTLPDIDSVLMVLMGLSSGTYLGKKLVTTGTTPTLLPSSVNVAGGTQTVSLYGVGFGTPPQGSAVVGGYVKPNGCGVMLDGYPAALAADWSDTQLTFRVDPAQPPISNWPAGPPPADRQTSGTVKVSVLSFGQPVGGPLDLTVTR